MRRFVFLCCFCLVGCATRVLNPGAAQLNAKLAVIYLRQGDLSRAQLHLQKALLENPESLSALEASGLYYQKLNDVNKARVYFKKAVELYPDSGAANNNYGGFLCRIHQYKESLRYFDRALRQPDYFNKFDAYSNVSVCAQRMGDMKLSRQYAEKAKMFAR